MGRLLRKSPTSAMRRGEGGLLSGSPGTLGNNAAGGYSGTRSSTSAFDFFLNSYFTRDCQTSV